jgi:hypothetical protein
MSGVTGSMALTGWALDDTGVQAVDIYRDTTTGEAPAVTLDGVGLIPIGTATFVEGARPDLQAQYSTLPFASRAGWGLMVLTNMLPNGGNGPYRFSVYARDFDGNRTLLGRRTVTCSNHNAWLPFGTLDTPAQGATVSGLTPVWGWALTPLPGVIPVDGSTIDVIVDGISVGHPQYGLERADIVGLFPNYNNTHTAVGVFMLDTTTLTNGTHSIAWVVGDNLGRAQGIGSRYFTVQNTTLAGIVPMSLKAGASTTTAAARTIGDPAPTSDRPMTTASASTTAADSPASDAGSSIDAPAVASPASPGASVEPAAPPAIAAALPDVTERERADSRRTPESKTDAAVLETAQRGDAAPISISARVEQTTTQPSMTLDVTKITTGATITVTVTNGAAHAKDRLVLYSSTASNDALLDWMFLNGERTEPAAGMEKAIVTITAPATPGAYVIRLMSEEDAAPLATSPVITVSAPRR